MTGYSTKFVLLTGATGLLGSEILRLLLRDGMEVAVMVRARSGVSPQRRVDSVLEQHEIHSALSRPRVVEASFDEPSLDVSPEDSHWLKGREVAVIHCAASIRFNEDKESGEPYRTNVRGTQNLLQFCKQLDVQEFHHVSTAYVGSRSDETRVQEKLISDPAAGGNDYEKSKITAENLVASCNHLGGITIHRPSIIVGDSKTGYTSTYHGFYAPLQLACQLAKSFGYSQQAGDWLRKQLGLGAADSKNLVPVDWVAESIVRTVAAKVDANRTATDPRVLHWTNTKPVSCGVMQEAISDIVERNFGSEKFEMINESTRPSDDQFRSALEVYDSYFNCDPVFDRTQAQVACPGLECPEVDLEMLEMLSMFAIGKNFGWPKERLPELPHQDLVAVLRAYSLAPDKSSPDTTLTVTLLGPGAPETLIYANTNGMWELLSPDCSREWPASTTGCWRCTLTLDSLAECIAGTISTIDAIVQGRIVVEGHAPNASVAIIEHWVDDVISRIRNTTQKTF